MNGFNKFAWPALLAVTLLMSILFIDGFRRVYTITGQGAERGVKSTSLESIEGPKKDLDTSESTENVILIIGDSIGAGIGDERNLGIGERFLSQMQFEDADTFEVFNMSVPGTITTQMKDNLFSGEFDKAIEDARYIFISIGGNNLNRMRRVDVEMKAIEFEEGLSEHLESLDQSLSYLRDLSLGSKIIILGLYNPYEDDEGSIDSRFLHEWNYQTRLKLLDFDQTYYVPLYDVFRENLNIYLSIDEFHPSGEGYQKIAERIAEILGL